VTARAYDVHRTYIARVRFEHLVEINDRTRPWAVVLTRAQLWRGLVVRAERPSLFLPSLSDATILARTEHGLVRVLRFGETHVTDEVHFEASREVRYEIAEQGEIPRSRLWMTIEEPEAGRLFVRFIYDDEGTAANADDDVDALRRAAYEANDLDTIATIRWLVENEELDRAAQPEHTGLPD
jgi:Domain of unknown function (DUF1857)